MQDLDALLSEIDPMRTSSASSAQGARDAPGVASHVAEEIYQKVLERREGELEGAASGHARRDMPPVGLTRTGWSARRAIVVCLVVAISVGLVVVPLAVLNHTSRHGLVPGHNVTTIRPLPTTTLPPPVSRGPWPTSVVSHADIAPRTALFVPAGSLSGSSPAVVLGFENDDCMEPCSEPLVRLDPQTGSLTVGPVVSADSYLEMVDHHVVLLTASEVSLDGGITGGWVLRSVNVASLQLGRAVKLPFLRNNDLWDGANSATGGASGTDDIWINRGRTLWLVDTSDGAIARKERLTGFLYSLALSPNGQTLYGLGTHQLLREMNARSGHVLASVPQADPNRSGQLTAVSGGVWVTTNRSARLLSSDDLRPITLPPGTLPPDPPAADTYRGLTVYSLGAVVLVQSYRGMTCLAPETGMLRATALWAAKSAPQWIPVGVTGGSVLAVESLGITTPPSGVFDVWVSPACLG